MSVERAQGVILRTRLLTETSAIVDWLTAEQGRIATVAKGARRPKSPFRGKLDLFFEADFSFQRSRRSDLHMLREVVVTHSHPALRTRLENVRQAAYATALLEIASERETAVAFLYDLLRELLACLGTNPASPQTLLAFELKVLADAGLSPDLAHSRLSAGTEALARMLVGRPLAEALQVPVDTALVLELDRYLHRFIAQHLERVPRGRTEALGGSSPPATPLNPASMR